VERGYSLENDMPFDKTVGSMYNGKCCLKRFRVQVKSGSTETEKAKVNTLLTGESGSGKILNATEKCCEE
jgi:hypothetical protein